MSFMPSPGTLVRLHGGRVGVVTVVTPDGRGDRVWTGSLELPVTADDIDTIIYEPEEAA